MRDKKKKGYMFLIFILLLAVTGVFYLGTESFQIKKITVIGNEIIDEKEIIKRSGISFNQNIFKLDKEIVEERIESVPYLEVVSIRPNYPDEVVITVHEKAAAIIPYLNSYFIIDKDCYIMEIVNEIEEVLYPLVQDMEVRSFVVVKN